MKKNLIALAVLAASGVAMAQSTVTLYGVADAWIGQTSSTNAAGVKVKQTKIDSGAFNGSRWGLKGAEDLGGGMKAVFTLESGFDISNGSVGSVLFGRQAFVGLESGFGSVTLGRQYTAYDALRGATNQAFDTDFATTGGVWANGIDYAPRANNSIAYTSPSFGGISGAVVYGLGENKNLATTNPLTNNAGGNATDNLSLHVKYANGPVLVGYAYQEEKQAAALGATQDKNKYNLIAGSYDFGVAALTGGYNQAKNNTTKDNEFQVGVSVPFGAASVALGYAHSKSVVSGVTNKTEGYSLTGLYDLSKRTGLYAGLSNVKTKETSVKSSLFAAGVRHSF